MPTTTSPKMIIFAATAAICMGTIGVISRLSELDAATVTFFRLFIGGTLLLILMLVTGQSKQLRAKPHPLMLVNGAMIAGFMTFFVSSLNHTTMLIAVMALYLAPVVATVIAHFALKDRLNRYSALSVVVVLLGFALVMYQPADASAPETSWLGLALALAGMACYAGFILFNRMIPSHYHEFTKCSWQFLIGAICVTPMFLHSDATLSQTQWGWMLLAGIFPGFLGIVLAIYAIKRMPAATFSTISYIEPISAVMLGWVVFQESLSLIQMLGCTVIIMASIAQGIRPPRRKPIAIKN